MSCRDGIKRRRHTARFPACAVVAALVLLSSSNDFYHTSTFFATALPAVDTSSTLAPTTSSTPSSGVLTHNKIIRSIGFRECASDTSSSSSSSSSLASSASIRLSNLALMYDGKENTISLQADGSTEKELDASSAHILLTAYDRVVYDHTTNLTKVAPFIPRFKGQFSFQETFPAPAIVPAKIPKQLFSFPAVEALASIQLYDSKGSPILCASVPLTNTVSAHSPVITIASVSLTAAAVALSAIAGLAASLSSTSILSMPQVLSSSSASSASSSSLSPSAWDVVTFCQFIAMSGSLNIEYPELLQQWTQNFGWSMGLVQVEGWNMAINRLRERIELGNKAKNESNDLLGSASTTNSTTSATAGLERMLFNGSESADRNIPSTAGVAVAVPLNATVTTLSMQSMMDGAVKSLIQHPVFEGQNQTASELIAKMQTSKVQVVKPANGDIAAVPSTSVQLLSRRQDTAAPPPPPPPSGSAPASPPALAPVPAPLPPTSPSLAVPANEPIPPPPAPPLQSPVMIPIDSTFPTPTPEGQQQPQPTLLTSFPVAQPGLTAFGQRLNIPAQNMFMTSLFCFLLLLLVTTLVAIVVRISLEIYAYFKPGKFTKLRRRFSQHYCGHMLRIVLLAYFAVATMAFYQLTLETTTTSTTATTTTTTAAACWPITFLAVMTLLLFVGVVTYITLRLRRSGGTSLFFDERLKSKYGALYDQYIMSAYLFFIPVLVYQLFKAAIVGLGQGSSQQEDQQGHPRPRHGWVQIFFLLLLEVGFTCLLFWKRPFADRVPNRLNAVLGCVRVVNVVMLAVLVEKSVLSNVSRTVVGVLVAVTQALVMVMLACLVFYQLGKALWRLRTVLKANAKIKKNVKTIGGGLLQQVHGQEVLVISAGDDEDHNNNGYSDLGRKFCKDKDGEGRESPRRKGGEYERGSDSMASLVGRMGIGQNPSIHYTPASDDECEGDGENGCFELISQQPQNHRDSIPKGLTEVNATNSSVHKVVLGNSSDGNNARDSTVSLESESSHILDYYNPTYLPSSFRNKLLSQIQERNVNPSIYIVEPTEHISTNERNDCGPQGRIDGGSSRSSLAVPGAFAEPWVQSAYMTRRRSESSAHLNKIASTTQMVMRPKDREESHDNDWSRRRPASLGGLARPALDPNTFTTTATATGKHASRGSIFRRESLAAITYIPESLLAGPPPASTSVSKPRCTSVTSAMLTTPPSMSPVLSAAFGGQHIKQQQQKDDQSIILSTTTDSNMSSPALSPLSSHGLDAVASAPVSNIANFNTYRFPDERPPPEALTTATARTITATQRNIHPLSPFHPDYQHPDDLYNPNLPSPNECYPKLSVPVSVSDHRSFGNCSSSGGGGGYTNPNQSEANTSRFAARPGITAHETSNSIHNDRLKNKRARAGLTIVTTWKPPMGQSPSPPPLPPPQVPLPMVQLLPSTTTTKTRLISAEEAKKAEMNTDIRIRTPLSSGGKSVHEMEDVAEADIQGLVSIPWIQQQQQQPEQHELTPDSMNSNLKEEQVRDSSPPPLNNHHKRAVTTVVPLTQQVNIISSTLRPATPSDVGAILRLIHELAKYEREPESTVEATEQSLLNTLRFSPEQIPTSQNLASCLLAFIPSESEPVGFALYFTNYSTWRGKGGIYLEDLFVRESVRGQKIGKRLLGELAREVTEMNGGRLEWAVLKWNEPSIQFYKSIGAVVMEEWHTMRVDGDALVKLAKDGFGIQGKSTTLI
ncbi:hypothetical protein BG004_001002 [Podila humilis]|nr:hypothetical protein BG004_001002 [Podila humilis]